MSGNHIAYLFDSAGTNYYRSQPFIHLAAAGAGAGTWQSTYFRRRVPVAVGDIYRIGVWFELGQYWRTLDFCTAGNVTHGPITMLQDTALQPNNAYNYAHDPAAPHSYRGSAYGIDVIFWDGVS
jgi:hypothetical protein